MDKNIIRNGCPNRNIGSRCTHRCSKLKFPNDVTNVVCYELIGAKMTILKDLFDPTYMLIFEKSIISNPDRKSTHIHLSSRKKHKKKLHFNKRAIKAVKCNRSKSKVNSDILGRLLKKLKTTKKGNKLCRRSSSCIVHKTFSINCFVHKQRETNRLKSPRLPSLMEAICKRNGNSDTVDQSFGHCKYVEGLAEWLRQKDKNSINIKSVESDAIQAVVVIQSRRRDIYFLTCNDLLSKLSVYGIRFCYNVLRIGGKSFLNSRAMELKLRTIRTYSIQTTCTISSTDILLQMEEFKNKIEWLMFEMDETNVAQVNDSISKILMKIKQLQDVFNRKSSNKEYEYKVKFNNIAEKIYKSIELAFKPMSYSEIEEFENALSDIYDQDTDGSEINNKLKCFAKELRKVYLDKMEFETCLEKNLQNNKNKKFMQGVDYLSCIPRIQEKLNKKNVSNYQNDKIYNTEDDNYENEIDEIVNDISWDSDVEDSDVKRNGDSKNEVEIKKLKDIFKNDELFASLDENLIGTDRNVTDSNFSINEEEILNIKLNDESRVDTKKDEIRRKNSVHFNETVNWIISDDTIQDDLDRVTEKILREELVPKNISKPRNTPPDKTKNIIKKNRSKSSSIHDKINVKENKNTDLSLTNKKSTTHWRDILSRNSTQRSVVKKDSEKWKNMLCRRDVNTKTSSETNYLLPRTDSLHKKETIQTKKSTHTISIENKKGSNVNKQISIQKKDSIRKKDVCKSESTHKKDTCKKESKHKKDSICKKELTHKSDIDKKETLQRKELLQRKDSSCRKDSFGRKDSINKKSSAGKVIKHGEDKFGSKTSLRVKESLHKKEPLHGNESKYNMTDPLHRNVSPHKYDSIYDQNLSLTQNDSIKSTSPHKNGSFHKKDSLYKCNSTQKNCTKNKNLSPTKSKESVLKKDTICKSDKSPRRSMSIKELPSRKDSKSIKDTGSIKSSSVKSERKVNYPLKKSASTPKNMNLLNAPDTKKQLKKPTVSPKSCVPNLKRFEFNKRTIDVTCTNLNEINSVIENLIGVVTDHLGYFSGNDVGAIESLSNLSFANVCKSLTAIKEIQDSNDGRFTNNQITKRNYINEGKLNVKKSIHQMKSFNEESFRIAQEDLIKLRTLQESLMLQNKMTNDLDSEECTSQKLLRVIDKKLEHVNEKIADINKLQTRDESQQETARNPEEIHNTESNNDTNPEDRNSNAPFDGNWHDSVSEQIFSMERPSDESIILEESMLIQKIMNHQRLDQRDLHILQKSVIVNKIMKDEKLDLNYLKSLEKIHDSQIDNFSPNRSSAEIVVETLSTEKSINQLVTAADDIKAKISTAVGNSVEDLKSLQQSININKMNIKEMIEDARETSLMLQNVDESSIGSQLYNLENELDNVEQGLELFEQGFQRFDNDLEDLKYGLHLETKLERLDSKLRVRDMLKSFESGFEDAESDKLQCGATKDKTEKKTGEGSESEGVGSGIDDISFKTRSGKESQDGFETAIEEASVSTGKNEDNTSEPVSFYSSDKNTHDIKTVQHFRKITKDGNDSDNSASDNTEEGLDTIIPLKKISEEQVRAVDILMSVAKDMKDTYFSFMNNINNKHAKINDTSKISTIVTDNITNNKIKYDSTDGNNVNNKVGNLMETDCNNVVEDNLSSYTDRMDVFSKQTICSNQKESQYKIVNNTTFNEGNLEKDTFSMDTIVENINLLNDTVESEKNSVIALINTFDARRTNSITTTYSNLSETKSSVPDINEINSIMDEIKSVAFDIKTEILTSSNSNLIHSLTKFRKNSSFISMDSSVISVKETPPSINLNRVSNDSGVICNDKETVPSVNLPTIHESKELISMSEEELMEIKRELSMTNPLMFNRYFPEQTNSSSSNFIRNETIKIPSYGSIVDLQSDESVTSRKKLYENHSEKLFCHLHESRSNTLMKKLSDSIMILNNIEKEFTEITNDVLSCLSVTIEDNLNSKSMLIKHVKNLSKTLPFKQIEDKKAVPIVKPTNDKPTNARKFTWSKSKIGSGRYVKTKKESSGSINASQFKEQLNNEKNMKTNSKKSRFEEVEKQCKQSRTNQSKRLFENNDFEQFKRSMMEELNKVDRGKNFNKNQMGDLKDFKNNATSKKETNEIADESKNVENELTTNEFSIKIQQSLEKLKTLAKDKGIKIDQDFIDSFTKNLSRCKSLMDSREVSKVLITNSVENVQSVNERNKKTESKPGGKRLHKIRVKPKHFSKIQFTKLIKLQSRRNISSVHKFPVITEHKIESFKHPSTAPKEYERRIYDQSFVDYSLTYEQALELFRPKGLKPKASIKNNSVKKEVIVAEDPKPKLDIYIMKNDQLKKTAGDNYFSFSTLNYQSPEVDSTPRQAAMPLKTVESKQLRKLFGTDREPPIGGFIKDIDTLTPKMQNDKFQTTKYPMNIEKFTKSPLKHKRKLSPPKKNAPSPLMEVQEMLKQTTSIFKNIHLLNKRICNSKRPKKIIIRKKNEANKTIPIVQDDPLPEDKISIQSIPPINPVMLFSKPSTFLQLFNGSQKSDDQMSTQTKVIEVESKKSLPKPEPEKTMIETEAETALKNAIYFTCNPERNAAKIQGPIADKQELVDKIKSNLDNFQKKLTKLSERYMLHVDSDSLELIQSCTKNEKIILEDENGEKSELEVVKYIDAKDCAVDSKNVVIKNLHNALMIIKKLKEASKAIEVCKKDTVETPKPIKTASKSSTMSSRKSSRVKKLKPYVKKKIIDSPLVETKNLTKMKKAETKNVRIPSRQITPLICKERNATSPTKSTKLVEKISNKQSQKVQPKINTIVPCSNVKKLSAQSAQRGEPDEFAKLTMDSLPPIQSEYPRRDNQVHASIENTFLYKLVYDDYDPNMVEPHIKCSDDQCTVCAIVEKKEDSNKEPLNCHLGAKKRRETKFDFKRYWDDLKVRYGNYHRNYMTYPLSVNYPPKKTDAIPPPLPSPRFSQNLQNRTPIIKTADSKIQRNIEHSILRTVTKVNKQLRSRTSSRSATPKLNNTKVRKNQSNTQRKVQKRMEEDFFNKNYNQVLAIEADEKVLKEKMLEDNGEDLQNYIDVVEQKFLKTFSLPEKEKVKAYRVLEQEIKSMLEILTNKTDKDLNAGISKSLERIKNRMAENEKRSFEDPNLSKNVTVLKEIKRMLNQEDDKQAVEDDEIKKKTRKFPQPTDTKQFLNNLQSIISNKHKSIDILKSPKKSKSLSNQIVEKNPCALSKSDQLFNSEEEYETIQEETTSDSSSNTENIDYIQIPLRLSTTPHDSIGNKTTLSRSTSQITDEYDPAKNVKNVTVLRVNDEKTISNTTVYESSTEASSSSDYSSISDTIKSTDRNNDTDTNAEQTVSEKILEFLDIITSFSFDNMNKIEQHLCRTVRYIHILHLTTTEYDLIVHRRVHERYGSLSDTLIEVSQNLHKLTPTKPRYRMMSFKDTNLRRYVSLPQFDLTDNMFLQHICRNNSEPIKTLMFHQNEPESVYRTMVLNLQLMKSSINPAGTSVRSLKKRRRVKTRKYIHVGKKRKLNAIQLLQSDINYKTRYRIVLIPLYLLVFVIVFFSLVLNYVCE